MNRLFGPVRVVALLATLIHPAWAQQPTPSPGDRHEHEQQAPAPSPPAPGGAAPHGGAAGGGMMGGGMMGGGMMGAMRAGPGGADPMGLCPTAPMMAHHDATSMARSLKLCGDLLKAMGDVLIKHGQALEAEAAKK